MFTTVLSRILSFFMTVIMIIAAPVNLFTGNKRAAISTLEDDCRLIFAAISDTHIDEKTSFISNTMLKTGLRDMQRAKDRLDAVVFDGDITNHGYFKQWDMFAESVSQYNFTDNICLVVGNHDTWGPNRDDFTNPVDGVLPTFIKYNKEISGREIDNMYYSDIINGYYFIMLGSEEDHTCAYLSDAQLEWFAEELKKASGTSLPIFVFLHQPINQTHGLPYSWELDKSDPPDEGGIGDQSDRVVEILKKYDNVFYISGHIHAGFKRAQDKIGTDYASVEYMKNDNGNNVTLINIPSFTNPDVRRGGHIPNGCGWIIEAYENKVVLRARNFAAGTYLTKYDVTVDIVK